MTTREGLYYCRNEDYEKVVRIVCLSVRLLFAEEGGVLDGISSGFAGRRDFVGWAGRWHGFVLD